MPASSTNVLEARKQPRQSRSQATVSFLLEAAIQVLRTQGYARFTTTRVADVAGFSVGTLYQYFPHKQALLAALVEAHMREVRQHMAAALQQANAMPTADAIRFLVQELIAMKQRNLERSLALRAPLAELGFERLMRKGTRQITKALEVFVRPRLAAERAAQAGTIAFVMVSSLEAVLGRAIEENPALLRDAQFARELELLIAGYLRPSEGERPRTRQHRKA